MAETFEAMREGGTGPDTIWLDGEFVDWADAQVHVLTHALHYGTAVFEGVRCYDTEAGPAIFRWEDHLERFSASARALGIEVPYDRAALTTAATGLIARADLGACYLRPLAFYGYGRLGVDPDGNPARTTIAAWPWGTYLGEDALTEGIEVAVSSWRRYAGEAIPTTVKATGPYVNGALASREARANGYDEALLLNAAGRGALHAGAGRGRPLGHHTRERGPARPGPRLRGPRRREHRTRRALHRRRIVLHGHGGRGHAHRIGRRRAGR